MIVLALALLFVLAAAALIGFVYYMETHLPPAGDSDVIIVLGAQVKEDGTPSVALERRLTAALEAYQAKPQLIIACGAQGANEPRGGRRHAGLADGARRRRGGCRGGDGFL